MKDQSKNRQKLFSSLPAVDKLLRHPSIRDLCENQPERYVHHCTRMVIEEIRRRITDGTINDVDTIPGMDEIVPRIEHLVMEGLSNKLMRVINGAGVILHTGLGRAPLAPSAQAALSEAATRYCILATERVSGKRGDRNRHTEEMLRELTGAEASLIVNNNSAAVLLSLNSFGEGREAIVSRGELVEIGGAFRVPDVMERSGSIMVEVGTTNKTHLRDYEAAITENSAYILKVHTSNYRIEGFHQEVSVKDLSELAHKHNLLLLMDIGSGALVDLQKWGLTYEPTVPEAVADGADVVTFSGDKLLGGPQCGVIVGKKELIDKMKRNPLNRAIRCDKLILSALNGTLKLFLDPDGLPDTHPLYAMITAPLDTVNRRARRIARRIKDAAGDRFEVKVIDGVAEMGSGALPARPIQSRLVTVSSEDLTTDQLALVLRLSVPPLFTRIEDDKVIIDARTVADDEVRLIGEIFRTVTSDRLTEAMQNNQALSLKKKGKVSGKSDLPALG
ncbi:L-seryl-tRNA(Sec) selenium transferase [bacterium]|nr:L-seryl-tRNA(Sec) selenium transferase [bacterium]